jgi:hypothetical protein
MHTIFMMCFEVLVLVLHLVPGLIFPLLLLLSLVLLLVLRVHLVLLLALLLLSSRFHDGVLE